MNKVIILSAGSGKRMNSEVKKQYMQICGKPLVYYTLKVFEECEEIDEIILVIAPEDETYIRKEIIERYNIEKVTAITYGGKERYNSVYNGLKYIKDDDIVLVHDGARPFIEKKVIKSLIEAAKAGEACITAVKTKDTVKLVDDKGYVTSTPNRSNVWNVQTPQVFVGADITKAYDKMMSSGDETITDDAMVMEKYGDKPVKVIEGTYENIKITTPDDIQVAEMIVLKQQEIL